MDTHISTVVSTRELLTFFYRNRVRLFAAFLIPFVLALAISFIPAPKYEATAVLTVHMGSEYVYQPELASPQNTPQNFIPFDRDQIFKSEVAILGSTDLHKEVIKAIGIGTLYPSLADDAQEDEAYALSEAAIKFQKNLAVDLQKESSVITVGFSHSDAEIGIKALDTLLSLYLEKRKSLYSESRVEMAKEHSGDARKRLLGAENALEQFKRQHRILSFEAERQNLIAQRSELQRQASIVSSAALDSKLAFFEEKLRRLNDTEAMFNALSHDVQVANDEYSVFAHRLSEATAYEDMERMRAGSVRIIQPPSVPPEPKNLQPIIIAGGFILSLMSVVVVALILDFFGSGFATPEQLTKATGLPVLAVLSRKN